MGNLLDNAIKYAPGGSEVILSVDGGNGSPRVRIIDRGAGIPRAERDRVLQRFYRVGPSRTVAGSGLGLSLVAAIIRLHGFSIEIADADPGCEIRLVCAASSPALGSLQGRHTLPVS